MPPIGTPHARSSVLNAPFRLPILIARKLPAVAALGITTTSSTKGKRRSLAHFVGAQHETSRNVVADRLRGAKIDDQLEPRRLLDRQVGWLGAAQQRRELSAHYVAIELKDARLHRP